MYVEKAAKTTFVQKRRVFNVDKIDTYIHTWSQILMFRLSSDEFQIRLGKIRQKSEF